ncbi:potassium channel family protein [bacterium]|nr:potassium channel family protein [bacterium]
MISLTTTDDHGVTDYTFTGQLVIGLAATITVILVFASGVLFFESGSPEANVKTYGDAVWLMGMSASTIGFGDFYPVTFGGRVITFTMFALGIGLMGFTGSVIAGKLFGWSDTAIKNRELRTQNAKIIEQTQFCRIQNARIIKLLGGNGDE